MVTVVSLYACELIIKMMCMHAHECVLRCTSILECVLRCTSILECVLRCTSILESAHCCSCSGVVRIACEVQVEWGVVESDSVDNDFKGGAVHGYIHGFC